MKRLRRKARPNWVERVSALGITDPVYTAERGTEEREWNEDAVYVFTPDEIETLRSASVRMREMVLAAVDTAIANPPLLERMGFPEQTQALLAWSWNEGHRNLIGRYDWSFDGTAAPKLLEINGETCFGMLATARLQADFLNDQYPGLQQWNSLEDDLVGAFGRLRELRRKDVVFTCDDEDPSCVYETRFVYDCLQAAKRRGRYVPLVDIAFNEDSRYFVDGDDQPIDALFLYQHWSLSIESELAEYFFSDERVATLMLEPVWRLLVSNKAFLAWLWEMNEGDELLLPTYVDHDPTADGLGDSYARKPQFGADGANVTLMRDGHTLAENLDPNVDSSDGYIYQALCPLPEFDGGFHPVCCTWEVADRLSALCVYEGGLITDYFAPIVPHVIESGGDA